MPTKKKPNVKQGIKHDFMPVGGVGPSPEVAHEMLDKHKHGLRKRKRNVKLKVGREIVMGKQGESMWDRIKGSLKTRSIVPKDKKRNNPGHSY